MEKQLEQLYELKKQGVITQKEFDTQKAKILSGDFAVSKALSAKPGTLKFALSEFFKNYAGIWRSSFCF